MVHIKHNARKTYKTTILYHLFLVIDLKILGENANIFRLK